MARRRHSNRRRRRGNFGFLYKLLSVLVICGAVVAALTLFFRVDHIVVSGTQRYTDDEVIAASRVELGDNLFLLNKYEAARHIAEDLPDTLLIDVEECSAVFAVVQGGSAWLVSPKGKIVEQRPAAQALDEPVIDGCELLAPSVGTDMALATEYAGRQASLLALLAALDDQQLLDQVQAIHLADPGQLTMDYADRFTVEMAYGADYERMLQILTGAIGKLESNQTGTFHLDPESEYEAVLTLD